MKRYILLVAGMIILSCHPFAQPSTTQTERLDSFITRTMADWHVAGLAVAIVKKDSILFARGYGYRDVGNKLPVNENTVFPIASCSKSFTTALIGMAEKEGKIKLNKPVYTYFPGLQLYTDQMT